jgi:DNA-binding NtrC family response regulator
MNEIGFIEPMNSKQWAPVLGAMLRDGNVKAMQIVTDALQNARGCVAEAAKKLKVPRRTLVRWISTVPGLKTVRDGARAAKEG